MLVETLLGLVVVTVAVFFGAVAWLWTHAMVTVPVLVGAWALLAYGRPAISHNSSAPRHLCTRLANS